MSAHFLEIERKYIEYKARRQSLKRESEVETQRVDVSRSGLYREAELGTQSLTESIFQRGNDILKLTEGNEHLIGKNRELSAKIKNAQNQQRLYSQLSRLKAQKRMLESNNIEATKTIAELTSMLDDYVLKAQSYHRQLEELQNSLKQVTECVICLSYMKDPAMLACGHLFCSTCLGIIKDKNDFFWDKDHKCSICRTRGAILSGPTRVFRQIFSVFEPQHASPPQEGSLQAGSRHIAKDHATDNDSDSADSDDSTYSANSGNSSYMDEANGSNVE